ncbi:GNAT family N-acetyltransferase [Carnobacterium maltaromaticum]|uniref:GNAT family N-acetyltransferase n=2 Tax=Carnobacteriaceae TaxID=186828 RepID=UPI0039BE291C
MKKNEINYQQATPKDYAQIIQVWKRSVLATHHFLKPEDMSSIEAEIRYWLPKMNVQVWSQSEKMIGFSAVSEDTLEMLFIDPNQIGKGYGKQILKELLSAFEFTKVDVNEQNEAAVTFYLKNGFQIAARDELDSEGRAYPILHLELTQNS